jgi:hypothetical protein
LTPRRDDLLLWAVLGVVATGLLLVIGLVLDLVRVL